MQVLKKNSIRSYTQKSTRNGRLIMTALAAMTCAMSVMAQPQLLVGGAYNSVEDHAVVGSESTPVLGAAGMTQALPRLAIPATVLTDGPAGVRIEPVRKGSDQTYYVTTFPVGSCLASTWNEELVTRFRTVETTRRRTDSAL